jgi:hypothetical protein
MSEGFSMVRVTSPPFASRLVLSNFSAEGSAFSASSEPPRGALSAACSLASAPSSSSSVAAV